MNTERIGGWVQSLMAGLSMGVLYDLLLWLVVALVTWVCVRVARRWVDREVDDVNRRHRIRKMVGYAGAVLVAVVGLAFVVGRSLPAAALLGILGAGAAIALQDVAKNTVGWLYLSTRTGVAPGARIEVDGVVGEVIDVGVLKTTVLEVGNLVGARQSTGRLGTVPNARFLTGTVLFSPDYSPYGWNEISFLLTYESDWRLGAEVLEEVGQSLHEELAAGAEEGFRRLERRYAFMHGPLTPIVYVAAADSGVELVLRYLTHIRQRRGSEDRIARAMLEAVEREEGLDFAYPTWRVYRRGEDRGPWPTLEGPAPAPPDAGGEAGPAPEGG